MLLNDAEMKAVEIGLRHRLGAGSCVTGLIVLLHAVNRSGPPAGPLEKSESGDTVVETPTEDSFPSLIPAPLDDLTQPDVRES